eukprot:gb/GEZN01009437.1/.p1 GENE.gb/GEZN01009437.1/~~gb/GEZN01009437.1/.p1  ORF type:complete len:435 (+),score=-46.21 gb/GEZN01009437.1/:148-1305(+)
MIFCGGLWFLWTLIIPTKLVSPINGWLIAILGLTVLATGFSPVPVAAAKGLIKLIGYLSVYALMQKLLDKLPCWWDGIAIAILSGELITTVIALRQVYAPLSELARWADPKSILSNTTRIYGTLGNPNLLAGYLIPILPLSLIGLLRWQGVIPRCFAFTAMVLGVFSVFLTYSRGGWLGLIASLSLFGLLFLLRQIYKWPLILRRLVPPLALLIGIMLLILVIIHVEPLRIRFASLFVGRGDSSNNFRINVWIASLRMIQDRPWFGIGPGNNSFNVIYPLYQQPKYNALSAYSVPLELLVECGIPMLLGNLGLLFESIRISLVRLEEQGPWILPSLAAISAITGILVQGLTDTIFFRPEVQICGCFWLATLSSTANFKINDSNKG